jgi:hypothetical protein
MSGKKKIKLCKKCKYPLNSSTCKQLKGIDKLLLNSAFIAVSFSFYAQLVMYLGAKTVYIVAGVGKNFEYTGIELGEVIFIPDLRIE